LVVGASEDLVSALLESEESPPQAARLSPTVTARATAAAVRVRGRRVVRFTIEYVSFRERRHAVAACQGDYDASGWSPAGVDRARYGDAYCRGGVV
jgi:hypothetical protein